MSTYRRPGSPFYQYEFEYAGKRLRGSTRCTSKREARAEELRLRKEAAQKAALARVTGSPVASLRMEDAALRYWKQIEGEHASATDTYRDIMRLVDHFGPAKLLSEIDDDAVAGLVAWRRQHRAKPHNAPERKKDSDYPFVSPATVNHTTIRLQALFTHAKKKWKDENGHKVRFPAEPDWEEHKLPVPKKRARTLKAKERDSFDAAKRDDYRAFLAFGDKSARRFSFCYSLKWAEVDFEAGVIIKDGKRRPDGTPKEEPLPITDEIRAILEPLVGQHPVYCFTYIARHNRAAWKKGETYVHKETGKPFVAPWNQRQLVKGQRYALLYNTAKTAFRRMRDAAGIENFGFHGIRRTRATEVNKETKDLGAVQKLLGHSSITTTMRYLDIDLEDVREAMEKTDARHRVPAQVPHTKGSQAA